MYNDTLILFASDNGGDLSKNNWPLRGSKYADFEGGIRTAAFLSGGYLPQSLHGTVNSEFVHITDWYRTFAELAGSSGDDNLTGLPPVDSLNMYVWNSFVHARHWKSFDFFSSAAGGPC